MVDSGYVSPTANVIVRGTSPILHRRNIGVATNMYPGRLVVREATDYDIKVGDGILPPLGWLGFEDFNETERPATIDTISTVDTEGPVHCGGGFAVRGKLTAGTVAVQGDLLASWSAGCVIPAELIGGCVAIKVPFSKNTSQKDTGVDIPAGAIIRDVIIKVTTADASGTIDVGLGNGTESGFDADGLLDGETLAATGYRQHNTVDATAANNTLGVLLVETDIKSADGTALYKSEKLEPGLVCDGTCVSLDYTTSNHTVVGYILVLLDSPGIRIVGKAGAAADASSAAVDVYVESDL